MIPYNSSDDFKLKWNGRVGKKWIDRLGRIPIKMKKCRIDEIYIISHGTIVGDKMNAVGCMSNTDGSRIYAKKINNMTPFDITVNSLKRKKLALH